MEESVGEEKFKGVLKYDITLVTILAITKNCPYNKSQTVFRYCLINYRYEAEWTEVDFSLCSPKTVTTKMLLSLNQVSHFDNNLFFIVYSTVLKVSKYGVFLVRIFPY